MNLLGGGLFRVVKTNEKYVSLEETYTLSLKSLTDLTMFNFKPGPHFCLKYSENPYTKCWKSED